MTASAFDTERARLSAARRLRPEHFDEFQRLAKSVVHGPQFQLLFVDCADSGYRDKIIDSLADVLRPLKLRALRLPLTARVHDAAALEARMKKQAAQAEVVHVLGGAWFTATRLDDLNQRRERLARDARSRWVFWLDASAIAILSRQAQDLWAWRSGVYSFEPQGVSPVALPALTGMAGATGATERGGPIDTRSMAERHRRVAELRRLLATLPTRADELRGPLLGELGRLLYSLGDLDEALAHWRDVELPFRKSQGIERNVAVTKGQIADVLQDRGQLDEALRIRREEELPVYERLGDQRSRLVCWANLAIGLRLRAGPGDAAEAHHLLAKALADAQQMGLPEADVIKRLMAEGAAEAKAE